MTVTEWLKKKIMKFLGLDKLPENPNNDRLLFVNDTENIKMEEVLANKTWYLGSGDQLLSLYTGENVSGFNNNPIFNRNKRNLFWSKSAQECNIKRVHSGLPHAIVQTTTNIVDYPDIKTNDQELWDKIVEVNDLRNKLTQQGRPLTLAEGWGAWKVNFNKQLCEYPIWEYYDGLDVEYIYKCGLMIGIVFKSYYKNDKNDNFVLLESRYTANKNSYIEYNLFKLQKNNEITEANLNDIPELADIPREKQEIKGLDCFLAVPSRYFYDPLNPKYGKSIYAGKIDLFDMLDEVWSQASQTVRVSTPVTWVNPDVMQRGANGAIGYENLYNRQIIMKEGIPDGEGHVNEDIITEQPDLNFDKYGMIAKDILDYILTGVLSPATLGIDVAKKDNAMAQREKEKVSIMFRNNIISAETKMLEQMVKISMMIKEYMDTGVITLEKDYNINIKYCEFANPSTETMLPVLGNAWSQGQLSTEKFVKMMWPDDTDEDQAKEMAWLEENRQKDDFDLGAMLNGGNEATTGENMVSAGEDEEDAVEPEEPVLDNNL